LAASGLGAHSAVAACIPLLEMLMRTSVSQTIQAGCVAGALFYLHALLPNSHAFPLIWPLLGGAFAVYLAMRRRGEVPGQMAIKTAIGAGAVAAALFLGATIPTLHALNAPVLTPLARALGAAGQVPVTGTAVSALAVASGIALVMAGLGGLLALPLVRSRRSSRIP
jgi:hypothetical protein